MRTVAQTKVATGDFPSIKVIFDTGERINLAVGDFDAADQYGIRELADSVWTDEVIAADAAQRAMVKEEA